MNAHLCCLLIAVLLCLSVCLSTTDSKYQARAKPGVCPDNKDMIGVCVEDCFGDRECPDDEKCCSNGCGHQCMPPYIAEKPGSCPKPVGFGLCAEMCSSDNNCPNNQKCCSNGCGNQCMAPYTAEKPGVCPMTLAGFGSLITVLLCLSVCLSTKDVKKYAKPGVCPDDKDMIGACVEKCFGDRECPDDEKCCSNGCGHQCMPPYTALKPGSCPKPIGFGHCAEKCSGDGSCPNNQKCCSNGCGHQCMAPYRVKPGVCPKTTPRIKGVCAELCSHDGDCPNHQKCCSNGCGHQCTALPKEKPGVCPMTLAGVKGPCEALCVSDFDCPRNQKCCSSICGGRICTPAS